MRKKVLKCLALVFAAISCTLTGAIFGHVLALNWIDNQFKRRENGKMCSMTYRFSEAYTEGYYKGRDDERDGKPRSAVRTDPYWKVITRKFKD